MRASFATVTFGLAFAGAAISNTDAYAQRAPNSYPYCALQTEGGTICYYDSHAQCSAASLGCIDNPAYIGGAAMARAERRHKPRR
jgi:hypothetical protein